MKRLFRVLAGIAGACFLFVVICYCSGNRYLLRGIRLSYLKGNTSANIYDYKDFDTRVIPNSGEISELPRSTEYNKTEMTPALKSMLDYTHSVSFLVLRKDSIVLEKYFDGHTDSTRSNSFSMAKSIITMLVQLAIQDSVIISWDEKVKTFLPWISGPHANELTLRHLSTMTAGLDWEEMYTNPFCVTAKAYYGQDIEKLMKTVRVVDKPGVEFNYQSGSTQLLGLALGVALKKPISEYASEKLWKPLGMEHPAYWSLDNENGKELAYCCFAAVTRDFARLGRMVSHAGRWNEKQILDAHFMTMAMQSYRDEVYGHSFWRGFTADYSFNLLRGIQGQFIIIVPAHELVIVRTGNDIKRGRRRLSDCIYTYVEEAVKMYGKTPRS